MLRCVKYIDGICLATFNYVKDFFVRWLKFMLRMCGGSEANCTNELTVEIPTVPNIPMAENRCYTHVNVVKFSFMWTINNFSLCNELGEKLRSSMFSSKANDKLKWFLELVVNRKNLSEDNKNYLELYLTFVSSDKAEVNVKFKLSILNTERKETYLKNAVRRFSQGHNSWGWSKFINKDFLLNKANGLLLNDRLTIFCEIIATLDIVNIPVQSNVIQFKISKCHLLNNLGQLFDNQKFSDVTLTTICGRELQAHKAILAAQSPVFFAMFEHEMEERKTNHVNITDVNHDVLREMLRFIYAGKVVNLEMIANDLLVAADKYGLERLKVMCEEALCKSLNIENAAEIFILADLYSADKLKAQVIDFINIYPMNVMDTVGFKSMVKLLPRPD